MADDDDDNNNNNNNSDHSQVHRSQGNIVAFVSSIKRASAAGQQDDGKKPNEEAKPSNIAVAVLDSIKPPQPPPPPPPHEENSKEPQSSPISEEMLAVVGESPRTETMTEASSEGESYTHDQQKLTGSDDTRKNGKLKPPFPLFAGPAATAAPLPPPPAATKTEATTQPESTSAPTTAVAVVTGAAEDSVADSEEKATRDDSDVERMAPARTNDLPLKDETKRGIDEDVEEEVKKNLQLEPAMENPNDEEAVPGSHEKRATGQDVDDNGDEPKEKLKKKVNLVKRSLLKVFSKREPKKEASEIETTDVPISQDSREVDEEGKKAKVPTADLQPDAAGLDTTPSIEPPEGETKRVSEDNTRAIVNVTPKDASYLEPAPEPEIDVSLYLDGKDSSSEHDLLHASLRKTSTSKPVPDPRKRAPVPYVLNGEADNVSEGMSSTDHQLHVEDTQEATPFILPSRSENSSRSGGKPSLSAARGGARTGAAGVIAQIHPSHHRGKLHHSSDISDDEDASLLKKEGPPGDSELMSTLAECSFSFVVAAPVISTPFITAIFVFALKTIIYILIATNLLTPDPKNRLGFPASVTLPVITSQFFALLITVTTQDDLVDALNLIYEGYDPEGLGRAFVGASFFKWSLDVAGLLIDGTLGLAVTFLLVVTSTDVVELLLNFTAIEFVSLLDNGAFLLAKLGFMGTSNKQYADIVTQTEYHVARKQNNSPTWQMWMLILMYIMLVAGWSIIYIGQARGLYTVGSIVVQFDDELNINLGTYSGRYVLQNQFPRFGFDAIHYVPDQRIGIFHDVSFNGTFAYCNQQEVWTFSLTSTDPCLEYLAKSSSSVDFDITTTNQDDWFTTDDPVRRRFFPMGNFQVVIGCKLDSDCGGGNGVCKRNRCECKEGFYGFRCDHEVSTTCSVIEADEFTAPFSGTQSYLNRFEMLTMASNSTTPALIYQRPVYVSEISPDGLGNIIFFSGLRWALFQLPPKLLSVTREGGLADYVNNNFNTRDFFFNVSEYFLSDPVTFNTPSDAATPVGLAWQLVRNDRGVTSFRNSDTVMICAVCSEQNPCANNNQCGSDNFCNCTNGATGTLCRIGPQGNGFCNEGYFNDVVFEYDGGDCCEATCRNEGSNTCGIEIDPTLGIKRIGFPSCQNKNLFCSPANGEEQCWNAKTDVITSISPSSGVSLVVAPNGRVLVESSPQQERVRVLDQTDAQWVQRGGTIEGVRGSRFGSVVAVHTTPSEATSRGIDGVTVVLAVALYRLEIGAVRVVYWDVDAQDWTQAGADINVCTEACNILSLGVARSGANITTAIGLEGGRLSVYAGSMSVSTSWTELGTVNAGFFSLSGNGGTLASLPSFNRFETTANIYNIDTKNATHPIQFLRSGRLDDGVSNTSMLDMKLSYSGRYLTAVLLGTRGAKDQAVRLDVSRDFPLGRLIRADIGPLSRQTLSAGFIPVSVNSGGQTFAFTLDKPQGLILKVYTYVPARHTFLQLGVDNSNVSLDSSFGVADDGSVLAIGRQGRVGIYDPFPSCVAGEMTYRLSANLEEDPRGVYWRVRSFRTFGNTTVYTERVDRSCHDCYSDTAFSFANINAVGCMDQNDCIEIDASDQVGNGTYFTTFIRNPIPYEGISQASEVSFLATVENQTVRTAQNKNMCRLTFPQQCSAGESEVVLALTLDFFVADHSWYLRNGNGAELDRAGNYTADQASTTVFHQTCVPSNSGCLSFSIEDLGNDGICCDFGEGRYSLFYNEELVVSRSGDQFGFGERVKFGDCNTTITPPDMVKISISIDAGADDLEWYVVDDNGKELGRWSATNNVAAQTIENEAHFFLEDTVGCLYFYIEDAGFDGFLGTNTGYEVSFNNEFVVLRDGRFGFAERTSFGRCAVETLRSELITVAVSLSGPAIDSNWYIGNARGEPIEGIYEPAANQTGTVVITQYDPIENNDVVICHTFSITDRTGDGNGPYTITQGWDRLLQKDGPTNLPYNETYGRSPISRNGAFGFGERVRFGRDCVNDTEVVFAGYKATVNLTLDNMMNETSWRVTTVNGVQLDGVAATPGAVLASNQVQQSFFHFPENSNDSCVYFFIEDTAGNGICCDGDFGRPVTGLNGGYQLSVDNSVVFTDDGRFAFGERIAFGRGCQQTKIRASRVFIEVDFDANPQEISWYIGDRNGSAIFGTVESGLPGQTTANSSAIVYDPSLGRSELCYTFTIVDASGNGMPNGGYSVGLGWDVVVQRSGDIGYGERIRFGFQGSCPFEVIPGFAATANVDIAYVPGQTSWTIVDSGGRELFSSMQGGLFSSFVAPTTATALMSSETVFHFPEGVNDDCLVFTIEDSAGSDYGNAMKNSYSLTVNGTDVLVNMNGIGYGEQVRFGNSGCNVTVLKATTVRVEIGLEADGSVANSTDWYLGDSLGNPLVTRETNSTSNASQSGLLVGVQYIPEQIGSLDFCFTFTIMDIFGLGNRGYVIYLGWKIIAFRNGQFRYAERTRFGQSCPTLFERFQGHQAVVDIFFDNLANETTWRLEDADGSVLGGGVGEQYVSANPLQRTRTTEMFYYFIDFPHSRQNDCITFFIDDVGADGICCPSVTSFVNQTTNETLFTLTPNGTTLTQAELDQRTGSYNLTVDGVLQYASDGRFGSGERVKFGWRSCNFEVNPLVTLNVEVGLDTRPEETGWNLSELASKRVIRDVPVGYYTGVGNSTLNVSNPVNIVSSNITNVTFGTSSVLETFLVYQDEALEFTITDSGNDGICCSYGFGYYQIGFNNTRTGASAVLVDTVGDFGFNDTVAFNVSFPGA